MPNKIAEARIEVKADGIGKVKSELKGVSAELKNTDKQSKKTAGGVGKIGKAAESLQSTFGKLLVPFAFVGALTGVLNTVIDIRRRGEEFQKTLAEISKQSNEIAADLARQNRGGIGSDEQLDKLRQTVGLFDTIQERADEIANRRIDFTDLFAAVGIGDSTSEQIAKLEEQANRASRQQKIAARDLLEIEEKRAQQQKELLDFENELLRRQVSGTEREKANIATSRRIFELRQLQKQAAEDEQAEIVEALEAQIRLVRQLGQENLRRVSEQKRAEERAAKEAEETRRSEARETARIIAEENARVLREFQQGLIDAATSSQTTGSFGQLEGLLAGIADDFKFIKGRIR